MENPTEWTSTGTGFDASSIGTSAVTRSGEEPATSTDTLQSPDHIQRSVVIMTPSMSPSTEV